MQEVDEKKNTESIRFISLCSDTSFKYLYKNIETRKWLNYIVKEKFNLDLSDFRLKDNELNTGNKIKDYRLDLVLENDNTVIIIEMNQDYYEFLQVKNYSYLYRTAGNRFLSGEDYSNKKTKLILFNDFKNPKDPMNKTGNYMLMDPNSKLVIEDIESFEIYLPNFKNSCYDSSEVDVSLKLFSASSYNEMRKLTSNPKDIKVIEELEKMAMEEEWVYAYDHEIVRKKTENSIRKESYQKGLEEGIEVGKEEGFEQGIEQGEKNQQLEIARSMLKDNVSVEIISKYTNLEIREIEKLKEINN